MSVIDVEVAMLDRGAFEEQRPLIQRKLEQAEHIAQAYLQRRFFKDEAALREAILAGEAGDDPIVINPSIEAACLLILGHLDENREDVITGITASDIPQGSRTLLHPFRIKLGV